MRTERRPGPHHRLPRLLAADGGGEVGLVTPRDVSAGGAVLVPGWRWRRASPSCQEPEHPQPSLSEEEAPALAGD